MRQANPNDWAKPLPGKAFHVFGGCPLAENVGHGRAVARDVENAALADRHDAGPGRQVALGRTPDTADHAQARARWLARHPKAQLYIDFGDFSLWQVQTERALLNAGFGRAWQLQAQDLRAG